MRVVDLVSEVLSELDREILSKENLCTMFIQCIYIVLVFMIRGFTATTCTTLVCLAAQNSSEVRWTVDIVYMSALIINNAYNTRGTFIYSFKS